MNNFIYKGVWWLPGNKDEKLHGQLIFEKDRGVTLELTGSFKGMSRGQHHQYGIILGISIDGKEITLHNCDVSRMLTYIPGLRNNFFHIQYVFIGKHFNNKEELRFSKLIGSFSHLDEWAEMYGFTIDLKDKHLSAGYTLPEPIIAETDKFIIKITPSIFPPLYEDIYQKEVIIKQKICFVIEFKETTSFPSILDCCYHFQKALTLATMEPSSIQELRVSCFPSETDTHGSKEAEVFFFNNQTNQKQLLPKDMIFTLPKTKDGFEVFIHNWFSRRETLEPIIELYFGVFYNPNMYLPQRFLYLTNALESYHRRFRNNYVLPKDEHKEKLDYILKACPQEHKNWLKEKLKYSNEPNLRNRLREILSMLDHFINAIITDKKWFIRKVVDSRNYYTHFDDHLKNKRATGAELYDISSKLLVMIEIILLRIVGFSDDQIDDMMPNILKHNFTANPDK